MAMTVNELLKALDRIRVETGSLVCLGCGYEHGCSVYGCAVLRAVRERLKQCEATGLTPKDCAEYRKFEDEIIASGKTFERLVELLRADKEGRVVLLPCKVGDTVYWVHNKTITRCRVYRIQKNHKGIFICLRGDGKSYGAFLADLTIGKTVFLTREEAEEALRRAENG